MIELFKDIFGASPIWPAFINAAAIFALFSYISNDVSEYTNKSLERWLTSSSYGTNDAKTITIEAFDRLYGRNLFSLNSFIRSSIISTIVSALVVYYLSRMTFNFIFTPCCGVSLQFIAQFLTNVILDYFSLFLVRRLLKESFVISAVFIGPIMGIIIVLFGYTIVDVIRFSYQTGTFNFIYLYDGMSDWINLIFYPGITSRKAILVGAIFVHAWLPLFALGAIIAKTLNVLRIITIDTQKLVKDGNKKPLRSMGYLIAAVTFVVSIIVQLLF